MIFLPTLSFFNTFFLILTLAIPLLLVLALYVLPLNLKVSHFFFCAVLPCLRVAVKTNFLADFLTLTFLRLNLYVIMVDFCVVVVEVDFLVFVLVFLLFVLINLESLKSTLPFSQTTLLSVKTQ